MRKFEGIRLYTLNIRKFNQGAACTIPGVGIFLGNEQVDNTGLLRHEFGHILQSRQNGTLFFWFRIAPASLWSAFRTSIIKKHNHMHSLSEWSANRLSYDYFRRPADWDFKSYPIQPFQ